MPRQFRPTRCSITRSGVVEETGVPGAAYAIVVDGRIETARGFGVRELGSQEPISAHTVFRIASVSKTFAAQLAAMLVDEGRLDWKLPLPRFAPDFRLKGGGESEAFPAPVTVPSQAEARGAKAPTKPSS